MPNIVLPEGYGLRDSTAQGQFPATPMMATTPASELMMLIRNQHALDPSVVDDASPPFFFGGEISSNRIDSYFTRMHETTLNNFAQDAQNGVSLQDSHNTRVLGFGRSLTGKVERYPGKGIDGGDLIRTLAEFYVVPGMQLNPNTSNDQVIAGLRWGTAKDMSVGFYGGEMRCSICNRDLWDWDCPHIPGVKYTELDADGNEQEAQLATAWIIDSRLAETSIVYDGATPGAGALKAIREIQVGRLRAQVATMIAHRYRSIGVMLPELTEERAKTHQVNIDLRGDTSAFMRSMTDITDVAQKAVRSAEEAAEIVEPDASEQEGAEVPPENTEPTRDAAAAPPPEPAPSNPPPPEPAPAPAPQPAPTAPTQPETARTHATMTVDLALMPIPPTVRATIQEAGFEVSEATNMGDALALMAREIMRLRPLADDGHAYKEDLIEDAMRQRGRVRGEKFNEEQYRGMLTGMKVSDIRVLRDDDAETAKGMFPGGRSSSDVGEPGPNDNDADTYEKNFGGGYRSKRVEAEEDVPDYVYGGR